MTDQMVLILDFQKNVLLKMNKFNNQNKYQNKYNIYLLNDYKKTQNNKN